MLLLGVTVLTSAPSKRCVKLASPTPSRTKCSRLAKLGVEAGIDGIVASPHEIKTFAREFGDKIKIAAREFGRVGQNRTIKSGS